MGPFVFEAPANRVVFAAGASAQLAGEVERLGAKRALVLVTPGHEAEGRKIAELLGPRACGVVATARVHVPAEVMLGLKNIKKTALYDGDVPIYHFYYGNDHGDESTLITTFPMRQSGRKARPGTGQISTVQLSVPPGSLEFWTTRLQDHGVTTRRDDKFGELHLAFAHPCGIAYELVEVAGDARSPYSKSRIPKEHAIRGTHGITVAVRDIENSDEFMQQGWNGAKRRTDRHFVRYEVGTGGTGTIVDFAVLPQLAAGSWQYGEGVPHHCAFQVADFTAQDGVKHHLVGLGYTDVSDRKDRGYFDSMYVRTPPAARCSKRRSASRPASPSTSPTISSGCRSRSRRRFSRARTSSRSTSSLCRAIDGGGESARGDPGRDPRRDGRRRRRVRETAAALASRGADVRLQERSGRPHLVDDAEVASARTMLAELVEARA